jgi:hypothetical protein
VKNHIALTAICLLTTGIATGDSVASSALRNQYYQPTFNCQGALPAYEGKLRKRPLGLANEGTTTAFVTCGLAMEMAGEMGISPGSQAVYVILTNRGSSSASISCTLVEGYGGHGQNYHPKTVTLDAGAMIDNFAWSASENGDNHYAWPSLSCALPPGVEINGTTQQFYEPIGA